MQYDVYDVRETILFRKNGISKINVATSFQSTAASLLCNVPPTSDEIVVVSHKLSRVRVFIFTTLKSLAIRALFREKVANVFSNEPFRSSLGHPLRLTIDTSLPK